MSHELRTPLNSIIGFTGIILQGMVGELNKEQKKQLTMVKNSANHLLSLINDILDISRIEAGKVELLIEEFDLSALVEEVKSSFKVAAEEKDLKMSLQMPKRLTIKSDERRTKQEGTGLGLYLSKKIADLLGSEIKAESEFGKGSLFAFALPLKYEGTKR